MSKATKKEMAMIEEAVGKTIVSLSELRAACMDRGMDEVVRSLSGNIDSLEEWFQNINATHDGRAIGRAGDGIVGNLNGGETT